MFRRSVIGRRHYTRSDGEQNNVHQPVSHGKTHVRPLHQKRQIQNKRHKLSEQDVEHHRSIQMEQQAPHEHDVRLRHHVLRKLVVVNNERLL